MKILQIFNKYVHVGGEELAVAQITAKLTARHEVRELIFDSNEWAARRSLFHRILQGMLMVWNPSSIAKTNRVIKEFKPDLILLHNVMPVGSSALYPALLASRIPLIHFIHNFRPFSVNGYCWANGALRYEGLDKNFLPEIKAGAWQGSRLKTAWYALQIRTLHALGVFERIHGWIAISRFMAKTFADSGIDKRRIEVIPHSWDLCSKEKAVSPIGHDEPLFLFLGRLSEEKGVRVLLDAWRVHEHSGLPGRLVIAGDGPLDEEVKMRCRTMSRAEHHGFVQGAAKDDLLRKCTALIIPSVWWEPLGLVIFEAYEYGKPVLAAQSGGIVDHVSDPLTGWLHEPGNASELASHIKQAVENPQSCIQRGAEGRKHLEHQTSEIWLDRFDSFTNQILQKSPTCHECQDSETPFDTWYPQPNQAPTSIRIMAYLADQHPKLGRSLGIARMTEVVLRALSSREGIQLGAVVSRSSIKAPEGTRPLVTVPWATRGRVMRALTDNLHPLISLPKSRPDVWYFPKGFMPRLSHAVQPSVATIHDTIIQYYQDHYPKWRLELEYSYWAAMLRNTLVHATEVMTVSHNAREQILDFIRRHGLPEREIHVTYESCLYENIPQPTAPPKADYVLHLASREPHKRTAWLVELWEKWAKAPDGTGLPKLHLVGKLPEDVVDLVARSPHMAHLPFLEDQALISQFIAARALLFPSEIEGFGLPAIEAYYLGTPVCFVQGTSVEEVLQPATSHGGFDLNDPETLLDALDKVLSLTPEEIHATGLALREEYHSSKVINHMIQVFYSVGRPTGR